ncbi:MAG: UbiH/UbiF/VisC/COQ6 family ubiquinone biosynthesis hydroxylase [Geminicoccaceae bacterium]
MSGAGDESFDLIVLGGGMTGLALAAALGSVGRKILVIERSKLELLLAAPHDGRVTAIAQGSKRFLDAIGAWTAIVEAAEPILDIVVREGFSPIEVHYDHRVIGAEPLGYIAENRVIRAALVARIATLPSVTVVAPAELADLEHGAAGVTVELDQGRRARAPLVALCEGRQSSTRERLGIGVREWRYGQTGIVCTLAHERPHHGLAVERFFPDGPFARLPMTGSRSSIVWALDDSISGDVLALDDLGFVGEVSERFGSDLGGLELASPRWAYPLSLALADRYTDERIALVGDAARGIHPIAGQGWNLAIRDVASLAETVTDRLRLGLDPGDPIALERYAAWRRFDGAALVAVTDGINRLFANDLLPVRMIREAGLAAVQRIGPLKRFFMQHAMGLVGDLPRTMRGLPL